ncbi:hypothetical protein ABIG05_006041 [Bradyrhizobium japonicum]
MKSIPRRFFLAIRHKPLDSLDDARKLILRYCTIPPARTILQ